VGFIVCGMMCRFGLSRRIIMGFLKKLFASEEQKEPTGPKLIEKNGLKYLSNSDDPYNGEWINILPNYTVIENYKKGKMDGKQIEYDNKSKDEDGFTTQVLGRKNRICTETDYKNGKKDGKEITRDVAGNIIKENVYKKNTLISSTTFNKNGEKKIEKVLEKGKLKTVYKKPKAKPKKNNIKIKWEFPNDHGREPYVDRVNSDSKSYQKKILEKARQSPEYAKAYSNMLIESGLGEYGLYEDDLFLQPKIEKIVKGHVKVFQGIEKKRLNILSKKIIELLKERGEKMPASDIDAHLKHKNVDEIKRICEKLYQSGKINRTGNYRYFILIEEKKKPKPKKKTSTSKPEAVDVKAELKKYKEMLDEGLITQEAYDAKMNQLLGL